MKSIHRHPFNKNASSFWIILCLLIIGFGAKAQDSPDYILTPLYNKGQLNLKVSLTSPILHNQYALLSGEYFIKDDVSIQLEAGRVFRYQPLVVEDGQTEDFRMDPGALSYTLRSEIRFFNFSLKDKRLYLAYQLLFNRLHYLDESVGCLLFDTNGFCLQDTITSFNIKRNVLAGHMKYGIQYQKGRWLFDFYGGIGVRYLENTVTNKLAGGFRGNNFFEVVDVIPDHDRDIRYLGISFILGMKLGFSWRATPK